MLSISGPMSGAGGASYYLELAREDYYLAGGEPPGAWIGKGAKDFNLRGKVEREPLRSLLLGFSPDRSEKLVQNAGNENRQSGWDLTFSAPKSVSLAWALASPEGQATIQKLQRAAVEKAVAYLEDVAGVTRRGRGGKETEKVGLIGASFEHGTSRAQDPQLHTHVLLLNIARREDGTSGTIRSRDVFRHKMAAGALYRTELAAGLERELGLSVHQADKAFAITGVNERVCREFSKRREQIEKFLAERGEHGAIAAKFAALETREVKGHVARADLFKAWQAFATEHGWGREHLQKLLETPAPERKDKPKAKELALEALKAISETKSVFAEREVMRLAADASLGFGFSAREIHEAVAKTFRSGQVVLLGVRDDERVFTTSENLVLEKRLLSDVEKSRLDRSHVVSSKNVDEELKQHAMLSAEQRQAVTHITVEAGSIKAVSGMAGTGKSTMLDVARRVWEASGFSVRGVALSGKAALGLQESSAIQSTTIAKAFLDLSRPKLAIKVQSGRLFPKAPDWSPLSRWKAPRLALRTNAGGVKLDAKTVLVVDEAGMVGTRQMKKLLDAAANAGAKVVLVGDSRQLQPIEAGGPFKAITQRLGAATLTDIKRQVAPWAREVVKLFADGKAKEALSRCAEHGLVNVASTRERAKEALVKDWKKEGVLNPKENVILANTNGEAKELNRLAQAERQRSGKLGSKTVLIEDTKIHIGDRVLFTKNARNLGVLNGSLGRVTDLGRYTMAVLLDDGMTVRIPLRDYQNIRLGYALTTHKAQGMTTGSTFILAGGAMQDREISYVQASRARGDTRFYTDQAVTDRNLVALSRVMEKSNQKDLAVDVQEMQRHRTKPLEHGR